MNELDDHYPEIIAIMPAEFTSHQFILALAREHQRASISALASQDGSDPFRRVHAQLAQRLHQHQDLIERQPDVDSSDIFDDVVQCATWRRL